MGSGMYSRDVHRDLTSSRASLPREQVFRQRECHPDMDPRGLKVRESRDSELHPNSIGVVFGLDQTGSMGHIPEMLAKEELPHFMETIEDGNFVRDPQVLFLAIGDATQSNEVAPLQVGQFESEATLMDACLTNIFLEGRGGGNNGESYDLAFYVAARHTSMDCYEKRGQKGYLFVTGDEPPLRVVGARHVKRLIGTSLEEDIPFKDIVEEASQTFHPFFLIPDVHRAQSCEREWRDVLGDNVIVLEDPKDTCLVAATLVGLTEGTLDDLSSLYTKFQSLGKDQEQIQRVMRAVGSYATSLGRGGTRRETKDVKKSSGKDKKSGNRRL